MPSSSSQFSKKYKVLSKLGEGSFSEVLKCQNRDSGIFYACKRLKKTYHSSNQITEIPEVVAVKKMSPHPNILHLIDSHYDPQQGRVTLVFEVMEMSLYDLIKTRKSTKGLPETRVKNYIFQLLKALEHMHKHGLFHRDIKPENILLKNDVLKLGDLGSIRGIYSRPPYTEYISTRWYRSPECLLTTGFYGPKMDIWAVGCVFYEIYTLRPLFPGANEVDQIDKIHEVLGTPNPRLLAKFTRHKSRNCEFLFPPKEGNGLKPLTPHLSENGREALKQMLIYDPDARPNVRRLLENRYFSEFRDLPRKRTYQVINKIAHELPSNWRNPIRSYVTTDNKRGVKRTIIQNVPEEISSMSSGRTGSSIVLRPLIKKTSLEKSILKPPSKRAERLSQDAEKQQQRHKEVEKILKQKAIDRVQRFEAQQRLLKAKCEASKKRQNNPSNSNLPKPYLLLNARLDCSSPTNSVRSRSVITMKSSPTKSCCSKMSCGTLPPQRKSPGGVDSPQNKMEISPKEQSAGNPSRSKIFSEDQASKVKKSTTSLNDRGPLKDKTAPNERPPQKGRGAPTTSTQYISCIHGCLGKDRCTQNAGSKSWRCNANCHKGTTLNQSGSLSKDWRQSKTQLTDMCQKLSLNSVRLSGKPPDRHSVLLNGKPPDVSKSNPKQTFRVYKRPSGSCTDSEDVREPVRRVSVTTQTNPVAEPNRKGPSMRRMLPTISERRSSSSSVTDCML